MPINKLFRDGKIKPEDVERLNHAFTFALSALSLVDRKTPSAKSSRARSSRSMLQAPAIRKRSVGWRPSPLLCPEMYAAVN
jgi:hypothetical protein